MMDFEIWKQRREEMMREAEQNRLARASRESRKRCGAGRASFPEKLENVPPLEPAAIEEGSG